MGTHTRDRATIRSLDRNGNVEVVLDRNSKTLKFNLQQHRHVDHAYTMTSHSAQSQTVERVLINVNTSDPRLRGLLNEVFAYIAASRPEFDLRLFADHASELYRVLSRENEKQKSGLGGSRHAPREARHGKARSLDERQNGNWRGG